MEKISIFFRAFHWRIWQKLWYQRYNKFSYTGLGLDFQWSPKLKNSKPSGPAHSPAHRNPYSFITPLRESELSVPRSWLLPEFYSAEMFSAASTSSLSESYRSSLSLHKLCLYHGFFFFNFYYWFWLFN